jgi:hypothetical protein
MRHASHLIRLLQRLQDLRSSSVVQQEQAAAAVVLQTEKQFEKLSVNAGAEATRASASTSLSFVASTSAAAAAAAATPTVSDVFRFSVAHPEDEKLAKKLEQNDPSAALYATRFPRSIFVTL